MSLTFCILTGPCCVGSKSSQQFWISSNTESPSWQQPLSCWMTRVVSLPKLASSGFWLAQTDLKQNSIFEWLSESLRIGWIEKTFQLHFNGFISHHINWCFLSKSSKDCCEELFPIILDKATEDFQKILVDIGLVPRSSRSNIKNKCLCQISTNLWRSFDNFLRAVVPVCREIYKPGSTYKDPTEGRVCTSQIWSLYVSIQT